MTRFTKLTLIFLFSFSLSACSLNFSDDGSDNPEVREVLVSLSSTYLINIVNGNFSELNAVILWDDYSKNKDKSFSKEEYFEELSKLDGRYTLKNHPLLNLKPGDFDISDDNADVVLTKNDSEDIELHFKWTGAAWQVTDDNLFGDDGIFGKLKKISDEEKKEAGKVRQKKLNALDLAL